MPEIDDNDDFENVIKKAFEGTNLNEFGENHLGAEYDWIIQNVRTVTNALNMV